MKCPDLLRFVLLIKVGVRCPIYCKMLWCNYRLRLEHLNRAIANLRVFVTLTRISMSQLQVHEDFPHCY